MGLANVMCRLSPGSTPRLHRRARSDDARFLTVGTSSWSAHVPMLPGGPAPLPTWRSTCIARQRFVGHKEHRLRRRWASAAAPAKRAATGLTVHLQARSATWAEAWSIGWLKVTLMTSLGPTYLKSSGRRDLQDGRADGAETPRYNPLRGSACRIDQAGSHPRLVLGRRQKTLFGRNW